MFHRQRFEKSTCYFFLLGPLFFPYVSYSDLGTVKSIDPQTLPQVQWDEHSIETTLPPDSHELPPPVKHFELARPWNWDTPAGPTAFVLDRNKVEIGIPIERISQLLSVDGLRVGAKYGITNAITAEATVGFNLATLGVRWNFFNQESWSFAARPWAGFSFNSSGGDSYYSHSRSNAPLGFELTASKILYEGHRLHFSLEAGHNSKESSYGGYSYNYAADGSSSNTSYTSVNNTEIYAARFTFAYELRISRNSGFTFWSAPELTSEKEDSSSSGSYSSSSKYNTSVTGIKIGAGYHFWKENFGTSVGIAAGPSFGSNQSDYSYSSHPYSYSYSSSSIQGAITGGINYRL